MKKIFVVFLGILILIVLFLLIIFKFFNSSTTAIPEPTQINSPVSISVGSTSIEADIFVKSFYQWYLSNASKDSLFPDFENRSLVLKDWMSSRFITEWDQAQFESEANPVLLTGEDTSSWTFVSATTITQMSDESSVRVVLNSNTSYHLFLIKLVRDLDMNWKIDSIINSY